jgi:hypothetical protein
MLPTGLQIRLTNGLKHEEVPAANVVGYIPWLSRLSPGQRILASASCSGPPVQERVLYPSADENAGGVAVMLETARVVRDLELVPKRTLVFAAFDQGGGSHFVDSPALPTQRSDIRTAVILYGTGAGEKRLARLDAGSGPAPAFDKSARRIGVPTKECPDMTAPATVIRWSIDLARLWW